MFRFRRPGDKDHVVYSTWLHHDLQNTAYKNQEKIRLMQNHLPGNCKEAEYGDEKREDAPDGEDQGHDQEVEGDHLIIFRE